MNIFDEIYNEVLTRIRAASFFGSGNDKIRRGNVIEHSIEETVKELSSSADYPKIEARYISVAADGATSNAAKYKATIKLIVRTGDNTYQTRLTPIMAEILQIADSLRWWRGTFADGYVFGSDNTGISTIGKYYDDNGGDQISGWAFEIDLIFGIAINHIER